LIDALHTPLLAKAKPASFLLTPTQVSWSADGSNFSQTNRLLSSTHYTQKIQELGLSKRVEAVKGTRGIGKKDMRLNDALPVIKVRIGVGCSACFVCCGCCGCRWGCRVG
jgi:hypothetical protein